MSQHDFNITPEDATSGQELRTEINDALQALASCSSGPTAPVTPYAYQFWADTTTGILKQRNAVNNAWNIVGPLPGAANVVASINVSSSPYTLSSNTRFLRVDASGGPITINLPWSGAYYPQEELIVKRTDSSANTVTLVPDNSGQGGVFDAIEAGHNTINKGCIRRYWPSGFMWHVTGIYEAPK